jgi:predicted GH43/DUF377 family glycosyl hydrolase
LSEGDHIITDLTGVWQLGAVILMALALLILQQSGVCDELRPDSERVVSSAESATVKAETKLRSICRTGEWFARYPGNPLSLPEYGAPGVVHPDIVYFPQGEDGFKFWLYYTPYAANLEHPCLVRSNDGINFVADSVMNPLLPGYQPWESGYLADVDVIKVGQVWYMYYLGVRYLDIDQPTTGPRLGCIGLATSLDGKHWNEYSGNPIFIPSLPWEADWVGSPSVYYDGQKFWMWFAGGYTGGIELASSLDGRNWIRENNGMPVLSGTHGTWDGCGVSHPDVFMYKDTLWMYYWGWRSCSYYCLGLAKSVDQVNWVKCQYNPVLDTVSHSWEGRHIYRSSPVIINDTMWLYYSAYTDIGDPIPKIGLAKSYAIVSGDADGSGRVDISDAVYLLSYIFAGTPPISPLEAGDTNASGVVDIFDVVFLINYIFAGGPPPCAIC